jgi:uncharacterized glyoxalase superfamily protein PhnB
MPSIATYRKQAKQLVRWHRLRNYSVGEKVRLLDRCRHLSDTDVLAMAMPLTLAQEIVAVEAGYRDWAALRAAAEPSGAPRLEAGQPALGEAIPILFVRDVTAAARFYEARLGFRLDFLHGEPPFYASVSRDRARLHLRFVDQPNFSELAARERSLIVAMIAAGDVKQLFKEFEARGVDFPQRLARQPWGGLDFHVRDPDGNVVSFVQTDRSG